MDRLVAMETFVRVIEAGSFSGAAKQLHIGQPAVSKAIAQLESRLGVRLLLRSTRGLTPTTAGRGFYERAKRSIEEADEAERTARGEAAALSGLLRICATVSFARLHVLPHLPVFLRAHPSLRIDVVLEDRDVDLVEAGIDVALRLGDLGASTLTARKIGQCQRSVIASPAYFDANGRPQDPSDLLGHQAIIYEQREGGATWTFRKDAEETTITLDGRVRVNAAEGVREGVLAGLGLTVASQWLFAPELSSGSVERTLTDWGLPPIALWAVLPMGRQSSAKARAFADFIEERISTDS